MRIEHLACLLEARLAALVPGARLCPLHPPQLPELSLWLLDPATAEAGVAPQWVAQLMDAPPFWCLCWGAGQALARHLLDHPDAVAGRTVIDLGSGCGVAGIAAALAGAARVVLCDRDPLALAAGRLNARWNGVRVECAPSLDDALARLASGERTRTLGLAADFRHDPASAPLLLRLAQATGAVWCADAAIAGPTPPQGQPLGGAWLPPFPGAETSPAFADVALWRLTT